MLKFHNKPFELIEPVEHHLRVEDFQPLQPLKLHKPQKPLKPLKHLFLFSFFPYFKNRKLNFPLGGSRGLTNNSAKLFHHKP